MGEKKWKCAVVVLGDIGRSPRMCNHAKSLADEGFDVDLVGFNDTKPDEMIVNNPRITVVGVAPPPDVFDKLPAIVQLPIKLVWNFISLFFTLCIRLGNLHAILIQNPPALPTIPVCYLISRINGCKLVIDWHNYMYTILKDKYDLSDEQVFGEQRGSTKSLIVRSVSWLEGYFGKLADHNLCVTKAMKNDLKNRWGINASTFYDRPPSWKFRPPATSKIYEVYEKLGISASPYTKKEDQVEHVPPTERPLILLSSTSWTPDEKFEILLDSLIEYNDTKSEDQPKILMIITGKGPLKQDYLRQIENRKMDNVQIITPWLEAEDYPLILRSADVGISLHTSTSGLDLPMKVVDMFGAKVGVLAKKFDCIGELVEEGRNGFLFVDSTGLTRCLRNLVENYPQRLDTLKENVEKQDFETWEQMWTSTARPAANLVYPTHQPSSSKLVPLIIGGLVLLWICKILGFWM